MDYMEIPLSESPERNLGNNDNKEALQRTRNNDEENLLGMKIEQAFCNVNIILAENWIILGHDKECTTSAWNGNLMSVRNTLPSLFPSTRWLVIAVAVRIFLATKRPFLPMINDLASRHWCLWPQKFVWFFLKITGILISFIYNIIHLYCKLSVTYRKFMMWWSSQKLSYNSDLNTI